ncbi:MAG: hypothetical protein AABY26_03430 [Nanoarchaeota archaeon]
MNIQNMRTNLALKLAPDDLSSLSSIDFPKPDPAKKQYYSELEVYAHSLREGNFIGVYVHPARVNIKPALYRAERKASHTFATSAEQLNELVERALESAGLEKFFCNKDTCGKNLTALGVYCYLLPQEHEKLIREALHPYWG